MKLDNVLIDGDRAKLTDFGLSTLCIKQTNILTKHAHRYARISAPELSQTGVHTISTDIYSYGIALYDMYCQLKHKYDKFQLHSNLKKIYNDTKILQLVYFCGSDFVGNRRGSFEDIINELESIKNSPDLMEVERQVHRQALIQLDSEVEEPTEDTPDESESGTGGYVEM